jgi:hypothetical protein
MSAVEPSPGLPADEALQLVDLAETALGPRDLEEIGERVLPAVAAMMRLSSAVLWAIEPRLPTPYFLQHGLPPEAASEIEDMCREQLAQTASLAGSPASTAIAPTAGRR